MRPQIPGVMLVTVSVGDVSFHGDAGGSLALTIGVVVCFPERLHASFLSKEVGMDEGQIGIRYTLSGVAAATVVIAAFLVAHPGSAASWFQGSDLTKVVAALLGSGGVGFVLAQAYHALPFSSPDYRRVFAEDATSRNAQEIDEADWPRACFDKHFAQLLGHYLWQVDVASGKENKALNRATQRYAARKAAIGTTALGILIGLVVFLIVLCRSDGADCVGVVLALTILVLPLLFLCYTHSRMGREHEQIVHWGLKRAWIAKDKENNKKNCAGEEHVQG